MVTPETGGGGVSNRRRTLRPLAGSGGVLIVWLLSAFVVIVMGVGFVRARSSSQRDICINNLRMISDAKDQYAIEYGGTGGMTITVAQVALYIKGVDCTCVCPLALGTNRALEGSYNINTLGTDPVCRISPTNADGSWNHGLLYVPHYHRHGWFASLWRSWWK